MKVLPYGASRMIGQGVLRECLLASDVERVTVIGRTGTGVVHAKLRGIVAPDIVAATDKAAKDAFDACLYCLGVSMSGLTEAEYTRTTFDMTMSIAAILSRTNPQMTFIYIQPLHGATSKTRSYRIMYMVVTPLFPLINALFDKYLLTTESIAVAMLNAVRRGAPRAVLEVADIKSPSSDAMSRG